MKNKTMRFDLDTETGQNSPNASMEGGGKLDPAAEIGELFLRTSPATTCRTGCRRSTDMTREFL
jgi:hypothetical protein